MRKVKILLIRPRPHKETIGLQHVMICEPLELEYLAGNLVKDDYDVQILDMIIEKKSIEYFLNRFNPDIVAVSGYITHIGIMKDISAKAKKFNNNITTVVGGVHAEVNPKDFISESIDYIICENPINTFIKIAEFKKNQLRNNEKNISNTYIEGTYAENIAIKFSAHFDALPPDRSSVLKYRRHYYYMFHNPCALIKTSFGCPFECKFCFCKEVTGGNFYERDIRSVIDEIESITEQEVYIVDDDFLFRRTRLMEFCEELEKRNIKKKFLVYGRADFIANNEDIISRLAKNGLRSVIVGIESVREEDLDKFNKKSDVYKSDLAIEILRKYDIELYATLILQPDFTKYDFDNLVDFLIERNVIFANLQPLTPLPGTDIFDEYKDEILIDREAYERWDLAHVALLPTKMSVRRYYYEIVRAYSRLLFRPAAISYMIKKYGLKAVLKLWYGSNFVTMQYVKKIMMGK